MANTTDLLAQAVGEIGELNTTYEQEVTKWQSERSAMQAQVTSVLNEKSQELTELGNLVLNNRIVGGNLLSDPWLLDVTATQVEGESVLVPNTPYFKPRINTKMQVVSQNTYAFGTRYAHTSVKESQLANPDSFTDDPWQATPDKPIFAHLHHKQIMAHGGLHAPEWSKLKKQGHVLKIEVPASDLRDKQNQDHPGHNGVSVNTGIYNATAGGLFLFRAWVYVKKGVLCFGDHAGYKGITRSQKWHANEFTPENANHPYKFVEFLVKSYRYNGNSLSSLNFASGDNNEALECYFACPQLFALDHTDDNKKPMSGATFGGTYA
ncbi:hypothetical protein [Pseudoalteromonas denitrificans]|uniref:Uncharacterized protein n=1 Tax=Pseudoalteromonas denitrificans DSM 6059 TaxID=1123010 RepID=A0A1I1Q388_9GAMM|nr:hypothetical protein [Pseudoalteromonas denitrificans]SFD16485.1 hypothetical protein SAMN02745724_03715 [Pseudoalteromonas denitrificans DSM 6059]